MLGKPCRGSSLWGLALAVLGACASDGAVPQSHPDAGVPAPTTCGGLAAPSDACAACETSGCCDFATSCAADPACAALEKCLSACAGDLGCRTACAEAKGVPAAWPALATCQAKACADACDASCGKGLPLHDFQCQSCMLGPCCKQLTDCATDLDCTQFAGCLAGCKTDLQCADKCRVQHFAGSTKGLAAGQCAQGGECATTCTGNDLSCVGSVQWAGAPAGPYGFQLTLNDVQTNTPRAGVQLLVCTRLAVECTPVTAIAGAISGPDGQVGVLVNGSEIAWARLDGPDDFLPTLMFFRPHLVKVTLLGVYLYSLPAAIQQMASAAVVDPAKAQLHVFAQDCRGAPLVGARVEVEVLGKPMPVVYSRPDYTPDPKLTATSFTGEARALNIPVTDADGFPLADITVYAADGAKVAHTSVRVHAGYWSELWALGPTPATE